MAGKEWSRRKKRTPGEMRRRMKGKEMQQAETGGQDTTKYVAEVEMGNQTERKEKRGKVRKTAALKSDDVT
ncbi:hypothetical protein WR25_16165 [Diploscapter pachys]|uniref:Uncharacterized protein n=1 Tax=Diploscapter pachys TaxID=2018661 RepID=A0A2A2JNW0_9BILA|nr:hypothetical protein WR25_16165 [Diploscapter pachys]